MGVCHCPSSSLPFFDSVTFCVPDSFSHCLVSMGPWIFRVLSLYVSVSFFYLCTFLPHLSLSLFLFIFIPLSQSSFDFPPTYISFTNTPTQCVWWQTAPMKPILGVLSPQQVTITLFSHIFSLWFFFYLFFFIWEWSSSTKQILLISSPQGWNFMLNRSLLNSKIAVSGSKITVSGLCLDLLPCLSFLSSSRNTPQKGHDKGVATGNFLWYEGWRFTDSK